MLAASCQWRWEGALIYMEIVRINQSIARSWEDTPPGPLRTEVLEAHRDYEAIALEETLRLFSSPEIKRHIPTAELDYLAELMIDLFTAEQIGEARRNLAEDSELENIIAAEAL